MHSTTIYPFGIRIDEPVTAITDLLVTAVCWYAWYRLGHRSSSNGAMSLFRGFFLLMGAGTLLGGLLGHAFLYGFSAAYRFPGWFVSMAAIALLWAGVLRHSQEVLPRYLFRFLWWANIPLMFCFGWLSLRSGNFAFVGIHSAIALGGVVLGICVHNWRRGFFTGFSKNFVAGIGLSVLAGVIFALKWGLGAWFTPADAGHVLMAGSILFFHQGLLHISTPVSRSIQTDLPQPGP